MRKHNNKIQEAVHQLFEARVHLGHRKGRWNSKMAPFIYGVREGIHILDLNKTVSFLFQRPVYCTVRECIRSKMIKIVEEFLKETKCVCYGGTAINNILP